MSDLQVKEVYAYRAFVEPPPLSKKRENRPRSPQSLYLKVTFWLNLFGHPRS
jgi:hypothetical protein